ncbi:MAG TPA: GlsB/YeaQ/YmgE family stress response membrane protein [Vicinamibacteria bacterium]|nr:GlsB/YeaQ/YmgE family stress response membrane protein [Vicinamibacteria bacterium]
MDLVVALLVGGVVGWLAHLVRGTGHQTGVLAHVLVGLVGSVLGLWLAETAGMTATSGSGRWLAALAGAVILVGIVPLLRGLGGPAAR